MNIALKSHQLISGYAILLISLLGYIKRFRSIVFEYMNESQMVERERLVKTIKFK